MRRAGFARAATTTVVAAVLTGWAWSWRTTAAPHLTITFLDVGQGDSIVVRTPSGHILIVDTGRMTENNDAGRRVVLPFLRNLGINGIDGLLLTHPDDDHIGGAASILQRIRVARLFVYSDAVATPNWRYVLDVARRRGTKLVPLSRGQMLDFRDGVIVEVLNPPAGGLFRTEHKDNDASIVVRVRDANTSVLLTGDAEVSAEKDMVESGMEVGADILKLGHHGSKTSSSELFLNHVRPRLAIVSAGARNIYGHPHPAVLTRLAERGIRVLRTDRDGAITIVSDGQKMAVSHERR